MQPRVLYVSYDGATEPIGQSQVVPYLTRLAARGRDITLLSFEKPATSSAVMVSCAELLAAAGIRWRPLRYHKRPFVVAKPWDVAAATISALIAGRPRFSLIHARSYLPAAVAIALKRITGARMIFDMRNFWADEKVDAGAWRRGSFVWKSAKRLERSALHAADHIVTLTERARDEIPLVAGERIATRVSVIPTCVDLRRFSPRFSEERLRVIYAGSLGGRYLDQLVGAFFGAVHEKDPDAVLEVWTKGDAREVRKAALAAGATMESVLVRSGNHADVSAAMGRAHIGVSFLSDGYSNRSSLPTKIGEYLASGLVIVTTPGIGDIDDLLRAERDIGVVLPSTEPTPEDLAVAATEALRRARDPHTASRARAVAESRFSLESGVDAYDDIYRSLGA